MNVRRPAKADSAAVTELIGAMTTHFAGEPEQTERDLLDEWNDLDLDRDAWLVELDQELAGYAALSTGAHTYIDVYVHPRSFARGVGSHLAELAEREARRRGLLIGKGGLEGNAFRIAPPLTVDASEVDEALAILKESFEAAGAN